METSWANLHAKRSPHVLHGWACMAWTAWGGPMPCRRPLPKPLSPEEDSRPCGLGAPSPSRCGSAAALPSLPVAAPAGGEDDGLGVPGHPFCP